MFAAAAASCIECRAALSRLGWVMGKVMVTCSESDVCTCL
jgi:hypothetical protein